MTQYNNFLGYDLDDDGLLPDGEYVATITDCKLAPTKNNTGKTLNLTFDVAEGKFQGYQIQTSFNIHNQSVTAQKIARDNLRLVMDALGIQDPKSESDFCNIRVLITVGQSVNNYFTPPRKENVIRNYRRFEFTTATGNNEQRPWER